MNSGSGSAGSYKNLLESAVASALNLRVLVLFSTVLAATVGVWAFLNLHIDAVPDISNTQVTVTANARGLAPLEVEEYITYPLELHLQSLPRLKQLRSISKYALSQITCVFEDGTDIYWARQQVGERMHGAMDQIPPNLDANITLGPIATGLGEIYQFEVRGPGYTSMQLRDILDWQIIPAVKTVPGVDEVQSMGGDAKEYQVLLEPERLHGYLIMPRDVMAALAKNNANTGGGYLVDHGNQILLRAEGLLNTCDDIGNVIVRRTAKGTVRIKDLGTVVIGRRLPQSVATQNGCGQTVIGIVLMRKGENSRLVLEGVKRAIAKLAEALPPNVYVVPFYDRSSLIDKTISTVWHNLSAGAVLVVCILFLLLGNIRGALIAAAAIPLSLLGAVSFLTATGTSGNLLSLGAIDFGILIDGSVVMIDNIMSRLAGARGSAAGAPGEALSTADATTYGAPPPAVQLDIIKAAAVEVAAPVLFAVLIITVVYLPILYLPGTSGKTFQPMALTVVFGLLTALAIALFVVPALAFYLIKKPPVQQDRLMRSIGNFYEPILHNCCRHPRLTALWAVCIFAVSLICLPVMGTEFVPILKEGAVVLTVNRAASSSLEAAAQQTTLIEQVIREIPDVETVVSRTGHSEIAFDPMGPDESDVFVIFKPPSQWKTATTQQELENSIIKRLNQQVPGAAILLSQPIEQRMNELIAGVKGDVAVRVFGPDLYKLRELGMQVANVLRQVRGTGDIKVEQSSGLETLTAHLDSKSLAAYGVNAEDALDTVAAAVGGKVVGTILQGKPRYNLTVRFAPDSVRQSDDFGSLPVAMISGDLVPLRQLARIERADTHATIGHLAGDRDLTVQVNVRARDLGSYVQAAQDAVAQSILLPPGYRIEWGGQFENLREAQSKLIYLIPLSLILIFMLLYALFGDWRPCLLIFMNVPLAVSGGIFALLLRGMSISITAVVGFIALFGVAVLNGVVLVSTIRRIESSEGLDPAPAAVAAAKRRLRPVLMTALVASLGFLPMAMATSMGAEVQRPLASVVIGGLITSTLLTLLVLPAQYPTICRRRREE